VFFKVLAAIVTADAFDRHMREQQHQAWAAQEASHGAGAPDAASSDGSQLAPAGVSGWDSGAPERPT
jgi:hypothetical protein